METILTKGLTTLGLKTEASPQLLDFLPRGHLLQQVRILTHHIHQ